MVLNKNIKRDPFKKTDLKLSQKALGSLMLGLCLGFGGTLGLAIAPINAQAASADSGLSIKHDFNIPAGQLDQALNTFGQQAKLLLSVDSSLTTGLSSQAVSGNLTAPQALQKLLKGTQLEGHFLDEKTVTVLAANPTSSRRGDPLALEEIYVLGELQTRSIQDTQTSVAVVTGEDLSYRSDDDLLDIFERTPGITRSFGNSAVAIRGIDQNGAGGVAGSNGDTISISVDGAHVGGVGRHNAAVYSTWDLEQVEILRGPQSTQQGRNALAGSIIVRSKDPVYDTEVKGRIGGGNYQSRQGALVVNAPLIADKLAVRLSADRNQSDRFTDNISLGTDDFDSEERTTTRFSLRADPTEQLNAVYKFTHYDAEDGFSELIRSEFPDNRVAIEDTQSRRDRDLNSHNLRLNYTISPSLRIASETTYFDSELIQVADSDGTADPLGESNLNNNSHSFEQELRLHYETKRLRAVLGGFYTDISEDDGSNTLLTLAAPAGTTVTQISNSDTQTENYALFGELEYQLNDKIDIIAGGRYDNESVNNTASSNTTTNNPVIEPFLPASSNTSTSASYNAFLPKLGAVYNFTSDMSLGFTVQRGYRAGGASLNQFTGVVSEFDPEFTWNYELAFRSQWQDGRFTLNANLFHLDWKDQQVTTFGDSGNAFDVNVENAGESRSYGGEIELKAKPITGLSLFASLAYVDTKFENNFSSGVDLSGNEFPFASDLSAAVGAEYFLPSGFFMGLDASYTSDGFSDAANTESRRFDSRFLVNTRVGYETDQWRIFAYANNLFDRDYITRIRNNDTDINAGEPRQFGVILSVDFL